MSFSGLELRNIVVDYGAVSAVRGVSLSIPQGRITAILGANGAGKSSLLRAISGLQPVRSGQILLNGRDISNVPAHLRAAKGLAQVLEGRQVFGDLTVEANLRLAWRFGGRRRSWQHAIGQAFARHPTLGQERLSLAGALSGDMQLQLMLSAATIGAPSCLLLDEPSLGLAPPAQQEVYNFISELPGRYGTTILLSEQTPRLPLQFCDYGYVMRLGRVVAEGTPQVLIEAGVIRALSSAYI